MSEAFLVLDWILEASENLGVILWEVELLELQRLRFKGVNANGFNLLSSTYPGRRTSRDTTVDREEVDNMSEVGERDITKAEIVEAAVGHEDVGSVPSIAANVLMSKGTMSAGFGGYSRRTLGHAIPRLSSLDDSSNTFILKLDNVLVLAEVDGNSVL